jgi:hypothetical protein
VCRAAVAKKLSSISSMFCFPPASRTEGCGKLSIVDGEKTNRGDRDLSPQRHFSFNIKQYKIDEFGYKRFMTFFLR